MENLLNYLSKYKKELIFGPIFKLFEAIIEISLPFIIADTINKIEIMDNAFIIHRGFFMLFLVLIGLLSASIAQFFAAKSSQGFGLELRNNLFKHICQLSSIQVENFGSSALVNRITNDVTNLELAVSMFIRLVIRVPFIAIGSLIMVYIISKNLFITLLIATILLSFTIYLIIKYSSRFHSLSNKKLDKLALHVKENLVNIRIVRSFVGQKKEKHKFDILNNNIYELSNKANFISGLLNPINTLILDLSIILVLYIGNLQILSRTISQGNLIAIINYISQILLAIVVLSNLVIIYTKAFASLHRINEILNIVPLISSGNLTSFEENNIAIKFEDVSFSFNNIPFFSSVNLSINSGEKIGIIGLTGSGKSVFLNLINRTYDVNSGKIYLYGKNIKEYDLNFLKNNVRFIDQTPCFLTSTIKDNIKMSDECTDLEIETALELSYSLDFINSFDNKLNYLLENNANNLSGGQRQRISIARAFIGNPKILILDDTTSSLDFSTEANILNNIFNFVSVNNCTTFISSQKISTIYKCDKIIVFNNGNIENIGSHQDLLKTSKTYKKIYSMQAK